jgi:hypothetical protein
MYSALFRDSAWLMMQLIIFQRYYVPKARKSATELRQYNTYMRRYMRERAVVQGLGEGTSGTKRKATCK